MNESLTAPPSDRAFDELKVNRITRRSLYTLALIVFVSVYMRLMTPVLSGETAIPIFFITELLNALNVSLLWFVVYRHMGFVSALVAGLLFALNPWAIFYHAWLGMALPTTLWLLALLVAMHQKTWATQVAGLMMMVAILLALVTNPPLTQIQPVDVVHTAVGTHVEQILLDASISYPREIWTLGIGFAILLGFPALWFRSRFLFGLTVFLLAFPVIFYDILVRIRPEPFVFAHSLFLFCLLAGAGVAWLIHLLPGKPYSRMIVLAAYGAIFLSQGLWWLAVA